MTYRAVPEVPTNPVGRSPDGLGRYRLASKGYRMPLTGQPPPMDAWPYDLYPGDHNPRFEVFGAQRGRMVAGVGTVQSNASSADGSGVRYATLADSGRAQGMAKDYPEELDRLQKLEDVQGNGIFDPHGSHGNINPDDGVFQDRANLPGYLAREKMFAPSEVLDVTTGQPVVYVPGTPFMLDPRTPEALAELELYEPGWPGTGGRDVGDRSTVMPPDDSWAVTGVGSTARRRRRPTRGAETDEPAPAGNMAFMGAAAGVAIGLFAALAWPKRKKRRS